MRWHHSLLRFAEAGVSGFVELGPGGALSGMAKRTVAGARRSRWATPEDLDKLLDLIGSGLARAGTPEAGENLFVTERLVVSPGRRCVHSHAPGYGKAPPSTSAPCSAASATHEVRSPFAGRLQSFIAVETRTGDQPASRSPAGCPVDDKEIAARLRQRTPAAVKKEQTAPEKTSADFSVSGNAFHKRARCHERAPACC